MIDSTAAQRLVLTTVYPTGIMHGAL